MMGFRQTDETCFCNVVISGPINFSCGHRKYCVTTLCDVTQWSRDCHASEILHRRLLRRLYYFARLEIFTKTFRTSRTELLGAS